jgi:hypothetical protein
VPAISSLAALAALPGSSRSLGVWRSALDEPHDLRRVFELVDCTAQLHALAFGVMPICQRGALTPSRGSERHRALLRPVWPHAVPCPARSALPHVAIRGPKGTFQRAETAARSLAAFGS